MSVLSFDGERSTVAAGAESGRTKDAAVHNEAKTTPYGTGDRMRTSWSERKPSTAIDHVVGRRKCYRCPLASGYRKTRAVDHVAAQKCGNWNRRAESSKSLARAVRV